MPLAHAAFVDKCNTMSSHSTATVLDKLASGVTTNASQISRRKKSVVLALTGVLLLFVSLNLGILYFHPNHSYVILEGEASPRYFNSKVYKAKKEACDDGLKKGKYNFWLRYKRNDEVVCDMYARAYAEMEGEVGHGVPKIIHQSWKHVDVKEDFLVWSSSWKKVNPGHEYWFWTDEDNRELVATFYPQFLKTYGASMKSLTKVGRHAPYDPVAHTYFPRIFHIL